MSSVKTILIAHRQATVRDRFAAALADARHAFVTAEAGAVALERAANQDEPVSLALVDLGLTDNGVEFVRALGQAAGRALPVVVFAGTVTSADQVRALLALGVAGYINDFAPTPQILPSLAPHLFPDSFDRRSSPRVSLGVPVSYQAGQTIAGALTLNIGKGGVAIRTMSPIGADTAITIKFRLPGGNRDLEAVGRVAWSNRKVGMGIRFEQVEPADQAVIDAFVEQHRVAGSRLT